jgi:predicted secreted protein
MAAEKGSAFLLKVGDGAATPIYSTVAGLRTTQLSINGDAIVITNKGSGANCCRALACGRYRCRGLAFLQARPPKPG